MTNAVWTGSLSLGMVVVPVRLYPAIRKKAVRFHELDRRGRRVRHVRVSEPGAEPSVDWEPQMLHSPTPRREPAPALEPKRRTDAGMEPEPRSHTDAPEQRSPIFEVPAPEVAYEEIRKGYEIAPGEYVSMTREEVMTLAPERSRVIDVQQFVDVSAVDPVYFEARYYVVPDRDWSGPFRLLRDTMAAADRMAIGWVTLRSRRYLSAVRPYGDVMLLTTLVHADEIAKPEFWIPEAHAQPTDKEKKMARLLIDTLSGPFEPERYPDEHRQRVLEAIEAKTPTAAALATASSPTKVIDLMAALEASVKAAKAARNEEDRQAKPRPRRSTGA
jgi:DNA end-binding protein Ku